MGKKIIVVGAGASGMMAAIAARTNGAEVILLERNDRVGRKILATGNGRCNYTNKNLSIKNYHGQNPKFAYSSLSQFNVDTTIEYFEILGISPALGEDGKVFPLSFQSSSMVDILRYELENQGVRLYTEAYVREIENKNGKFKTILDDGRSFESDKVIIATGGMALPNSGSDGNGYQLCKSLGHSVVDISPGLIQLNLAGDKFKGMNGTKFVGRAELFVDDKKILQDTGDILFTSYGISGPPILNLSREAIVNLNKNKKVEIKVAVIHHMDREELYDYLLYRFSLMGHKTVEIALIGFINKKLILPILKSTSINKDKNSAELSKEEISELAEILTGWKYKVIGSQPWAHAQVTVGGISTEEINSKTMESKLVKGLFIVGELVDIDGDCGGFNLQWAWSSGYIAGEKAAIG